MDVYAHPIRPQHRLFLLMLATGLFLALLACGLLAWGTAIQAASPAAPSKAKAVLQTSPTVTPTATIT
ncbi:MAG: hypothetical protein D6759_08965, partial [Chloroflexi bacterium]